MIIRIVISTLLSLYFQRVKAESSELILSKYKGFPQAELGNRGDQFYKFTLCACDSQVFNPQKSHECECSPELYAKTASESSFQATYSASCLRSYNQRKCFNVNFPRKGFSSYFYVRVHLGDTIITNPVWQNIRNSHLKTIDTLTTTERKRIEITYQILSNFDETPKISNGKGNLKKLYKMTKMTTPAISLVIKDTPIQRLNTLEALKFFLLREGIRTGHPTGSFDVYTFKNRLVVHHNMARARHGCSALQRDYSMDSVAQRWADSLAANEDCLMHERPKNYGENLFFFGARHLVSPDLFAEAVTHSFYQEGIGYDYDRFNPGGYHRVGHFTQLIWRSTKRMGVGIAIRTSTGRGRCIRQSGLPLVYVVVKYDPMGNMQSYSQYMQNVSPPLFKRKRI